MYVGGEVSIGSSLINFLGQKSVAGLDPVEASKYVSLFWGGMLIGRFMGAVELSEMRKVNKQLFLVCHSRRRLRDPGGASRLGRREELPAAAGGLLGAVPIRQGARRAHPHDLLGDDHAAPRDRHRVRGPLAMWCVVGVGLFTSIGWPNIFSLALDGMGAYKSQVSSLLVMAILGGALLPPLQGHIADVAGLQISFVVPLVAYAYVGFYGWKGHKFGSRRLPAAA